MQGVGGCCTARKGRRLLLSIRYLAAAAATAASCSAVRLLGWVLAPAGALERAPPPPGLLLRPLIPVPGPAATLALLALQVVEGEHQRGKRVMVFCNTLASCRAGVCVAVCGGGGWAGLDG